MKPKTTIIHPTEPTGPGFVLKTSRADLVERYPAKQVELIEGTTRDQRNAELFWRKVEVLEVSLCWPWKAALNEKGYGRFAEYLGGGKFNRKLRVWLAHRYAFKLTYGGIDPSACACHKCDNPACCNPTHIFLGTRADNNRDMRAKGRAAPMPARWKGMRK